MRGEEERGRGARLFSCPLSMCFIAGCFSAMPLDRGAFRVRSVGVFPPPPDMGHENILIERLIDPTPQITRNIGSLQNREHTCLG